MDYTSRLSRSLFTINKMNSHKHLFNEHIWLEKETFEAFFLKLKDDHDSSDVIVSEKENLLAEKAKLIKAGYESLLLGRNRVKVKDKDNIKLYFGNFNSSNTRGNLKNIFLALSGALVMIKNEDFTVLNSFKKEYEDIVAKIDLFLSEKEDKLYKIELADKKTKSLEDGWDVEYQSLKYYVKAYCYKRKYMDYKDYFEDLGVSHKTNNNNESSEDKKVEVVEDTETPTDKSPSVE